MAGTEEVRDRVVRGQRESWGEIMLLLERRSRWRV